MSKKVFKKPYIVRFKVDEYLLVTMYLCFFNKIPLDLLITLYEKFEKHTLFFFKALACKGYIRVTDSQFYNIIESCKSLNKQIKNGNIDCTKFDEKMNKFISYLLQNSENLYDYEVRFFFDLNDFYNGSTT